VENLRQIQSTHLANWRMEMASNEKSGSKVGHIASQGLKNPGSLSNAQIKSLSASVMTQRPDHKSGGKKGK
jgi:hypothetical protein